MPHRLRLPVARLVAVVLLGWAASGCVERVNSRYADIDAARADRLFERGWLPDLLPPSSTAIRVSNDLDVNTSEGEFRFAPADYPAFVAHAATADGARRQAGAAASHRWELGMGL